MPDNRAPTDPSEDTGPKKVAVPPREKSRTAAAAREFLHAIASDTGVLAERIKAAATTAWKERNRSGQRQSAVRQRRTVAHRWPARLAAAIGIFIVVAVLATAGATLWALHDLPLDRAEAEGNAAGPSILLAASDGQELGRRGMIKLDDAPLSAFPDHLIAAVLAIEDRRFFSHLGVDPRGILRALRRNTAAGAVVEGGSTITQQLIKIEKLDDARTVSRKLREAIVAVWLERRLGKEEILARYLNKLYLGAGAVGMPAAARLYFNKEVSDLTLPESAMLAGLIRSPSQLNPIRDLQRARARAAIVLDAMLASGALDATDVAKAKADPAVLNVGSDSWGASSYFADWVAQESSEIAGSFTGTMRVRTTLVPSLQALAERVVEAALSNPETARGVSEAALVAMRPDGSVVAMVGGRNYESSKFNRAVQAMRQPGSAFKLFVYLAALRNGFTPDDRIEDVPFEIGGWSPKNFGDRYSGQVTLADAFARSINTVAARLALEVGVDQVITAARDLGIDAPLAENPSLALGTSEVSLLDLTGAYASVRAGRMPVEPWGIAAFGREGQTNLFSTSQPATPQKSLEPYRDNLVSLLRLVVERGTGRGAALDGFAAGKTGTSQEYRDAWFIGFNEPLVVGVWVGNDDGTPMDEVTGGSLPALIWKNFIAEASGMLPAAEPPAADGPLVAATNPADSLQTLPSAPADSICNYQACSRAYRSFRASDCTYQPYDGPRRQCTDGLDRTTAGLEADFVREGSADVFNALVEESTVAPAKVIHVEPEPESAGGPAPAFCDMNACSAAYRSFRASDCSFQPEDGGPRQICDRARVGAAEPEAPHPFEAFEAAPPAGAAASCDREACMAAYQSFRSSDCTYQPEDGGPRQICDRTIADAEVIAVPSGEMPFEAGPGAGYCNVSACAAQYRSFRASDCTYQPVDGGPRQFCDR
jgi:penicillin-binding protein 1A